MKVFKLEKEFRTVKRTLKDKYLLTKEEWLICITEFSLEFVSAALSFQGLSPNLASNIERI